MLRRSEAASQSISQRTSMSLDEQQPENTGDAPPSKAADGARPRLPRNVKLLGWTSFFNDIASEMVYPILPQFLLVVLGGNLFLLGIIEGAVESVSSVLKLWSGGRSDRVGRRKRFIVLGYSLASVARPTIGIVTAPWQLFAARLVDRSGKGVRTSPRDALIADSTEPEFRGRAFGFQRGMDHLGAAIGPLLAMAFLWFRPDQYRMLFLLTIIPGVMVVALVGLGLKERIISRAAAKSRFTFEAPPRGGKFRLYLVALGVFTLSNSSDMFLLVRAHELFVRAFEPDVATALLPALWCVFHVVKSGGNMIAGHAVDRLGPLPMIFGGWLFYALIYLGFGLASEAWQVWPLFLAYAVYYALSEPAEKTLVANLVGTDRRGLAYGWFNFVIGLTALPASLIFGAIYQFAGATAAFGWGAAVAVVATLILSRVR